MSGRGFCKLFCNMISSPFVYALHLFYQPDAHRILQTPEYRTVSAMGIISSWVDLLFYQILPDPPPHPSTTHMAPNLGDRHKMYLVQYTWCSGSYTLLLPRNYRDWNREEIKDIHGVVADWVGEKVCCLCAREGLCPSLNLTPKCLRAFQTTLEKKNNQV
jgi:hypothetical protein